MVKFTQYPTLEEALFLHGELINRFGGTHGVRDIGLLESALARLRSGYYMTILEQAAALMHSLIHNHCFVDGNKRISFALVATFLKINGYDLTVPAVNAENFIIRKLITERIEVKEISKWLEKYTKTSKSK